MANDAAGSRTSLGPVSVLSLRITAFRLGELLLLGLLLAAGACVRTAPPERATGPAARGANGALTPMGAPALSGEATPSSGLLAAGARAPGTAAPAQLQLLDAWPIEGPPGVTAADFQPSGLLLVQERLLAVSDRQDSVVFELQLSAAAVRAVPWLTFRAPVLPGQAPGRLDLEGLALDGSGGLVLLSEALLALLRVVDAGSGEVLPQVGRASWLPLLGGAPPSATQPDPRELRLEQASLRELGRAAGLFQVPGADLEGVAALPGGELLLAAERQPRGLVELGRGVPPQVWPMLESAWPVPQQRPADFSDLSVVGGRVYALVRNAHLLVRLERTRRGWREERAWNYAAAENDPRFVYADTRFGLAEGLAIGPNEIFIVLDNNGQSRRAAPADQRTLLFRFARPSDL